MITLTHHVHELGCCSYCWCWSCCLVFYWYIQSSPYHATEDDLPCTYSDPPTTQSSNQLLVIFVFCLVYTHVQLKTFAGCGSLPDTFVDIYIYIPICLCCVNTQADYCARARVCSHNIFFSAFASLFSRLIATILRPASALGRFWSRLRFGRRFRSRTRHSGGGSIGNCWEKWAHEKQGWRSVTMSCYRMKL